MRRSEAFEAAEIFAEACALAQPWSEKLGKVLNKGFDAFVQRYPDSELKKATMPLTRRMWALCRTSGGRHTGLLHYWAPDARKYPHKVVKLAT